MLEIYNAIKARLKEREDLFKQLDLPPVKHIDYDKGQYLSPQDFEIFPMPALFYTYNATWRNKPGNTQIGTATVDLKIVMPTSASIALNSSSILQAEEVLNYHKVVHASLQGLSTNEVSPLRRTQSGDDPSPVGLHIHNITYTAEVTDNSTHLLEGYVDTEIEDLNINGKVGAIEFLIE
ncbi:hypothetical protein [Flammeovirga sp. SJP92]|uniref:hypothetical protein n=1 Tax=Flammeovirga sp. SJP92 TaxID=1775430 RepID=UPI0007893AF8|nr:hypothetical protein [Flammeovirga sp. SJP92]KXX70606.1 hypothetical protein AVL50_07230 [Flammeovirga sp. SJP92]